MLEYLKNEGNIAYTENGARAFATTKSSLLDFFAQAGAMRHRPEQDIISMFSAAFAENPLYATRLLFYFRDIRGGQGERRLFRVIARYLADFHTSAITKNIHLIPEYGRWDDLYALVGTKAESAAALVIRHQWFEDEKALKAGKPISLQGKWLASENASSKERRKLAYWTMRVLGLTEWQYRRGLSARRKAINVVERLMSANRWDLIEYDKVPSKASMIYRNAFLRHDPVRYQQYLDNLINNTTKVNAATLYPYDIVGKILDGFGRVRRDLSWQDVALFDSMWNSLPNYFDKEENSIVVADVSGSMTWYGPPRPLWVSVALAIYAAERNKGKFHNHFITFSARPELVEIKGTNIVEKVASVVGSDWTQNTNIEAVFDLILNTAVKYRLPQNELPKKIYIISDMEFDRAASGRVDEALFRMIRDKFQQHGYEMPMLVFWNVAARNKQFPMTVDDRGVLFVSGASPAIFTNLLKGNIVAPHDLMMDIVNSKRYAPITV